MAITWDNEGYIELTKGRNNTRLDGRIHWKSRTLSESSRKSEVSYQVQLKLSDSVSSGTILENMNLKFSIAGYAYGDYQETTYYEGGNYISTYDKEKYGWSGSGAYNIKREWQDFFGGFAIEVEHRADGWGSSAIRVNISEDTSDGNSRYDLTHNYYGAESAYLIPLANMPLRTTITSATNFNSGTNPTIYYNNPAGDEVDSLQAGIFSKDGSKVYAAYRDISIYENSYTFNLTDTEISKLEADANEKDLQIRFYIRTNYAYQQDYHEDTPTTSTYYSASTKVYTPIDKSPVVSFVGVVDRNPVTIDLTGNDKTLVKYYSNAFVTAQVDTADNIDYDIAIYTYSSGYMDEATDGEIIGIIGRDIYYEVTDAEGRVSTAYYEHPEEFWVEYFKPTCVLQEAKIDLDKETNTAWISVSVSGEVFRGKFGADAAAKENDIRLQVRHTQNDDVMSEWREIPSFLPIFGDNNTYTASVDIRGFDYDKAHTVQCRIVDSLGAGETVEYTIRLNPVFDWGENDFSFNVPVSFQETVNFKETVSFQDSPMVDFIIEQGTDAMGTNGTWYWSKWKNGRAECYGIRNYGNMAVSTSFGGTLYASPSFNQDLPYGLFVEAPEYISIVPMSGGWGTYVNKGGGDAPTATTTGSFELVRPSAKNLTAANIGFHVIGRWK